MRQPAVGDALACCAAVAEHEVLILGTRGDRETADDALEVALVAAFPHAHEVGVDADLQTIPRPRMARGKVSCRIFAWSRSDRSRMYCVRSEEHTSELQSRNDISYAV